MWIDQRDLKTLAVAGVVLVVFGVGLWLPAELERHGLRQQIELTRQSLNSELADVKLLVPLQKEVAELQVTVEEASQGIPPQDELDQLLRRLTEALDAFALQQQEIIADRSRHYDDHSVSTVRMRFEGGFPATYGVLRQIEALPRLVRLDRVTFEPRSDEIGGLLRVDVQLSTFFTGAGEGR